MRRAQYGATPVLRSQAVKELGTTASVAAIDALIVLARCAAATTRYNAKVASSKENIGKLATRTALATSEPDAVDRCLRDLVLYAPTRCEAPSFALDVLAKRAATRHDSVCQALAYITELHTGIFGQARLRVVARARPWGRRLVAAVYQAAQSQRAACFGVYVCLHE